MRAFTAIFGLCLVAAAMCDGSANANTNNNAVPQFAEARDAYSAPTTTTFGDSTFTSTGSTTFGKPITYSSGHSVYSSDPGLSFGASFGPSGVNTYGNAGALTFPTDLLNTGLNLVLGLFAFSLLLQIVTKVTSSTFFDELFEARSLDSDDLVYAANLAMDAFHKYNEMNKVEANMPK